MGKVQPTPPRSIRGMLHPAGFEQIPINTENVFWKCLDEYSDRHVIVDSTGDQPSLYPDWLIRFAQISIYRGPQLREQLQHREVAYTPEDMEEFLLDLKRGTV